MTQKYQISANGRNCIGPCVPANSVILHPILLNSTTYDKNFCPVDKYMVKLKNGEIKIRYVDECDNPNEPTFQMSDLVTPQFQFCKKTFLSHYYNIKSLEEGLQWLSTNESKPLKTVERVFDFCMEEYSDELTIADNRLVQFIKRLCTKHIEEIYERLKYYIGVDNNEVCLINPSIISYPQNKEIIPVIMQYIIVKLITIENIQNFLNRLIEVNLKKAHMSTHIIQQFCEMLIKKIQSTIK